MPGREKLYICGDGDLPDPPRILACRAPEGCVGVWYAMTAYARAHLTDGRVPKTYVLRRDARNAPRLADMVANGLIGEDETHFEVLKYAPRNQTRAMVEDARSKAKDRMKRRRSANVRANNTGTDGEQTENTTGTHAEHPMDVPSSSSLSSSEIQEVQVVPVPGRRRPGVVAHEAKYWIAGYVRGASKALGYPFIFPAQEFGVEQTLADIVGARCADKSRSDAWLELESERFVTSVSKDEKWRFGYGPKGFLAWLNGGRPGLARPRGPDARPPDPDAGALGPEEAKAHLARLQETLAGAAVAPWVSGT